MEIEPCEMHKIVLYLYLHFYSATDVGAS